MKQTTNKVYGEDWVKDRIKDILKARDIYYFMPSANRFGKSGIPDFICCCRGIFIAIEAKATDPDPSEQQGVQMGLMEKAGGMTMLVNQYNLPKLEEWLDATVASTMLCGVDIASIK